jgi:hypothetical protein
MLYVQGMQHCCAGNSQQCSWSCTDMVSAAALHLRRFLLMLASIIGKRYLHVYGLKGMKMPGVFMAFEAGFQPGLSYAAAHTLRSACVAAQEPAAVTHVCGLHC